MQFTTLKFIKGVYNLKIFITFIGSVFVKEKTTLLLKKKRLIPGKFKKMYIFPCFFVNQTVLSLQLPFVQSLIFSKY